MKKEMTLRQHILELRRRLLLVLLFIGLFSVAGYFLFPYIFNFVSRTISEDLYVTKIYEAFITRLQIAVLIGCFLSIPFLLYEILAFILPALNKKEKIMIFSIITAAYLLFLGGIIFSLRLVLPISITFLKSGEFFPGNLNRLISYESFILFFAQFLVAFGVCMEFPVVIILLLFFKVLKLKKLIGFFKYFIALSLLIAGILTPPDIVSQLMLAVPMILLYLVSIIIGKIFKLG